jgi:hypothetical protein
MTLTVDTTEFLAWRDKLREAEDACPWPGPRPLRQEDGYQMLAGRDLDREQFGHVVQNQRLILLGGESGVGKSSLLDAGLVPDLKSAGYTAIVCRNWGADVETDDEVFLAHAVHSALHPKLQAEFAEDTSIFENLNTEFGDTLVIIFDQFEELLRYNRDRKANISQILLRIHQRYAIRMVLSFRSEYLHELKEIEAGAASWDLAKYLLNPVEEKYAPRVIATTRDQDTTAIAPNVAAELAERWKAGRADANGASGAVNRIGMLHLQAMLYALHDRARGGTIDEHTFASMREDASREGSSDAVLFAFGLQEAVSVKLRRCEVAASELGLDAYLVRGASTVLSRTAPHLSSGGYKLVHEAGDLAKLVLDDEIDICVDILDDGIERFEGDAKNDHDEPVSRMLLAIADDALRDVDDELSADESDGVDGTPIRRTDVGAALKESRSRLAEKADIGRQDDELSWSALLDRSQGANSPNNPAAGPLRGLSPAAVLIEELRRFAWALVWLKESNLVRITRHGPHSMVSLIHDGFGDALIEWEQYFKERDRAWALYALTAPEGDSHEWHDGVAWNTQAGEPATIENELCGTPDKPKVIANLCLKGNIILSARFANTVFVNCDFRQIKFQECSFEGVTFINCQLDGALLSDCTIIGQPAPGKDEPDDEGYENFVPDAPLFNIPGAESLARTFRQYRQDGPTDESYLVSQEASQPAVAVDEPISESSYWLDWAPAEGGLVVYGSRISALTIRGSKFQADSVISFRGVTGSGLDLAELADANFEFHRCLLRHVAFTSATKPNLTNLRVAITFSVLVQWWFGDGFSGSVGAKRSRLVQVWNDSEQVSTKYGKTSTRVAVIGPTHEAADEQFRRVVGRTDYRRR